MGRTVRLIFGGFVVAILVTIIGANNITAFGFGFGFFLIAGIYAQLEEITEELKKKNNEDTK